MKKRVKNSKLTLNRETLRHLVGATVLRPETGYPINPSVQWCFSDNCPPQYTDGVCGYTSAGGECDHACPIE